MTGSDPAARLLEACDSRGWTLGAAESCTGGLVAGALTAVPGASRVFQGALTAYSNGLKQRLLNVSAELLARQGAVSEACAAAMAEGARGLLDCDLAVSVTGIAGPEGGSPEKPVGLVCFAWRGPHGARQWQRRFSGSRDDVRKAAVQELLVETLKSLTVDKS